MGKKLGYDEVCKIFDAGGCKLLDDVYINAHTLLNYICSCGEESKITLSNFKRGSRCYKCGIKKNSEKRMYAQSEVEQIFKSGGCILLDEYNGDKKLLTYKCSCGNISKINLNNFQNGHRRAKCSGLEKHIQRDVEEYFKLNNCELLSKYKNNKTRLKYRCSCGNISFINFNRFQKGSRCRECGFEKLRGDQKKVAMNLKIKNFCRNLLHITLQTTKQNKVCRTEKILGYSKQQLLEHLQKDPHYDDWVEDSNTWHIDHIIPIKAFVEHNVIDPTTINSLNNLRIIHKVKNWAKNATYNEKDFTNYINSIGERR